MGRVTLIYSVTHFTVDFSCVLLMTALMIPVLESREQWLICVTLYNFCAFALQLPAGAFADRLRRNPELSAFGCTLVMGAWLLMGGWIAAGAGLAARLPGSFGIYTAAAVTAGLGNAFFHVGGGVEILGRSGRRAALPGIYVSTGALGVFLAGQVFRSGPSKTLLMSGAALLLLAVSAALLLWIRRSCRKYAGADGVSCSTGAGGEGCNTGASGAERRSGSPPAACDVPAEPAFCGNRDISKAWYPGGKCGVDAGFYLICLCLFLTVCLRSCLGTVIHYSWNSDFLTGLLFVLGVAGGKALGGIFGDRLGWCRVGTFSLLLSAGALAAGFSHPFFGILGIICFNMTMPLTLTALGELMPGHRGLAFGMTTFALFLGIVPSLLGNPGNLGRPVPLVLLVLLSALLLFVGLRMFEERETAKGLRNVNRQISRHRKTEQDCMPVNGPAGAEGQETERKSVGEDRK